MIVGAIGGDGVFGMHRIGVGDGSGIPRSIESGGGPQGVHPDGWQPERITANAQLIPTTRDNDIITFRAVWVGVNIFSSYFSPSN
jgi:hypothetical protein